jgi:hypothetical protein
MAYVSQMYLLQKLKILLVKETELTRLHPEVLKHGQNLIILKPLIYHLERSTQNSQRLISTDHSSLYRRGNEMEFSALEITE